MSLYRLYGAAQLSTDAVASLDIREDGVIERIQFNGQGFSNVGGSLTTMELSFSPTSSFTSNDTTQVIGTFTYGADDAAAVPMWGAIAMDKNVKVNAGDRLYLHVYHNATGTVHRQYVHIDVADGVSGKRTTSRR